MKLIKNSFAASYNLG